MFLPRILTFRPLQIALMFLAILFLFNYLSFNLFPEQNYKTKLPSPMRTPVENKILTGACYSYSNLTASNECCLLRNYSTDTNDVITCVTRDPRNLQGSNREKRLPDKLWEKAVGQHWVIYGDSHMRYIFNAIASRFERSKFKYKFERTNSFLNGSGQLNEPLHRTPYQEDLEMVHTEFPFNLTFIWDVKLTRLEDLITKWDTKVLPKPTHLVIGSALHWMDFTSLLYKTRGLLEASKPYESHMTGSVSLHLKKLAANIPVVFKLVDYLQIKGLESQRSPANIDRYNSIAISALSGTGVKIWDSTLPLSDMYNDECQVKNYNDEVSWFWICWDKNHIGYIMIHQYANMILNQICNPILEGLGDDSVYC